VSAEALAKADMLRRVPPKKSNQKDHGCKAVGLHKGRFMNTCTNRQVQEVDLGILGMSKHHE
jgi:hypothetical protein